MENYSLDNIQYMTRVATYFRMFDIYKEILDGTSMSSFYLARNFNGEGRVYIENYIKESMNEIVVLEDGGKKWE